jgi:hypothetical protein
MDFNINVKIEATPEFCRALDNIANTVTAAFCVTAATQVNTQERPAEIAAPMEEEHAPVYVPKQPPAPEEEKAPAEPSADFKAMRAELKSVMAKAAKEGKADAVKALLAELGVTKLSQIPEAKLAEALEKAGGI